MLPLPVIALLRYSGATHPHYIECVFGLRPRLIVRSAHASNRPSKLLSF